MTNHFNIIAQPPGQVSSVGGVKRDSKVIFFSVFPGPIEQKRRMFLMLMPQGMFCSDEKYQESERSSGLEDLILLW